MIIKKVKAPVRIDFAGGTTDIFPFVKTHGGVVLNAAINKYIEGRIISSEKIVSLDYKGNIPTSSGLGTSGTMNLVWLALITKIKDRKKLSEKVYDLEQSLGLVGGKQDQYASAFGGINFFEFNDNKVKINRLNLDKKFIEELESKLIIVYYGDHFSGDSNKRMVENLINGKNTENLLRIKKIAYEMKLALIKKSLEDFSDLMNQELKEREKLHASIVPSSLKNFISKGLKKGASAAKVLGAGGGGSVLFFADNKKKFQKEFGNRVINFKFDFQGIRWLR